MYMYESREEIFMHSTMLWLKPFQVRGGSRISEKGGLLINIHEVGEGSGAEPPAANAFLLYHAHNTT